MSTSIMIALGVVLFIIAVILIKNIIGFVLFRLVPLAFVGAIVWFFVERGGF